VLRRPLLLLLLLLCVWLRWYCIQADADEDYLERRISQRQAAVSRVNLQRLDAAALRRYRRFHKLPDVGPNSTKEQLLAAISRHFTQQVSSPHLALALPALSRWGFGRIMRSMTSPAVC